MLNWLKNLFPPTYSQQRRVYLDYAAATPVRPEVAKLMDSIQRTIYGNPSAIHREGVAARTVVNEARLKVARTLKVRPQHVTFASNGTESNNLAIYGTLRARQAAGMDFKAMEVITTALEHPSVSEVMHHLRELGVTVHHVPVDEKGLIDQTAFTALLSDKTVLVSVAYINSEVGVIQPISRLARAIKKHNQTTGAQTILHVDGAQAPLWEPCQFDTLGADLLSLDAGKCYGPKGVGVLAVRHGVELLPVLLGGGQERGLRAGTENTALIAGAAEAIVWAQAGQAERSERVRALRDRCLDELVELPGVVVNGSRRERVANNINISIPGLDTEFATVTLDAAGVAISTKSACSGADGSGSATVQTITGDQARATSTLRITLGEETNQTDLEYMVTVLATHIHKMTTFTASLTAD